jgi:2-polyprenyl-3-methyl-5-hydroxy-6-metoxy-1,4-benzoquinol methylase
MRSSLIGIHDLAIAIERARQGRLGEMLRRVLGRGLSDGGRWDHVAYPLKNWWDIPEVMERWNRMTTGDPATDYVRFFLGKYLAGRSGLRALSLGSGTGNREIELARSGVFARIDAVDLSRARVEYSRRRAGEAGLADRIAYHAANALAIELPRGSYDLVIAEQFLHHVDRVEDMIARIGDFLAPAGVFLFNEYVGPDRWQWTAAQLEAVNDLLEELPERRCRRWKSGTVKRAVHRPGVLLMMLYDRTEAVSSSRILPAARRRFEILELRGYGGSVLQLLFADIAQNFLSKDAETKRLLDRCFEREDALLASGAVAHDFVAGACGKAGIR